MRIGIPSERGDRERRVAITPPQALALVEAGHRVLVERGAGQRSGFDDDRYREAGASIETRDRVIAEATVIVQVDGPRPDDLVQPEWAALGAEHLLIGLHDPLGRPERVKALAGTGATALSLELIPRTTRAQAMDVLSSMATVAGYQAVLLAATRVPKLVPMLMTAAGTVPPARFLVLGAGVAGLQALATARRLGAVVAGYDVRPAAREQIESVGARAIDLDLDTGTAEAGGGYAAAQSEEQNRRQLELLAPHVAEADVVITTAAVPGAASPELVTPSMVESMARGSVLVDLAAARGGNCRLTVADDEVTHHGVTILGPTDLASRAPATSSQMFSSNVTALLRHLAVGGDPLIDLTDEITGATVVTCGAEIVHPEVRQRLGLALPGTGSVPAGEAHPGPEPATMEGER